MSTAIAESPVPREAFERFPGKWIAVRGTEIVAWADSLEDLESNPTVVETDTRALVPDATKHFYRWHA